VPPALFDTVEHCFEQLDDCPILISAKVFLVSNQPVQVQHPNRARGHTPLLR
jgi:hypothetical protein